MSYLCKLLPDGIKRKETERGSLRFVPPIPFVPSEISEKKIVEATKVEIKIDKHTTEHIPLFSGGNNESYLMYCNYLDGIIADKELQKNMRCG